MQSHVLSHVVSRNPGLATRSCRALLRWNRLNDALAAYRVAEEPHCGEALTGLAELRLDQRRYRDLLRFSGSRLADSAVEVQPRDANAWVHRNGALLHLGRVEQGVASTERALAIEPSNREAQQIGGLD